ncbi:2-dehydro-3-deoxy-6-phosphogalactonate aldolase [Photobacterium sanctipauli]|uniref:2-dehydro-3-deoxy-6-phosphogalactonate aldolase n=1 Tax=Photobacterium sanctipauli TaxID=1342794 RepID=A0A2T3P0R2_9GAMM|nr:2-dehydro-3-deoxy-6-phosphogalactonate aldolase [Photobacterium sanctipauli]PSW22113.1 2-dehydro-3-deoxy-6-phosphogalactonate aldolase [Photobacterium sanctipauli]
MTTKPFNLADNLPLVAIIRGVTPDEVIDITQVLIDEGFTMIEVPLNSPDALVSIKKLVDHFGSGYYIGAGTVTTPELAKQVIETGANLVVTPNFNEEVVKLSAAAGCITFPGVVTPTEAFAALAAGATGIKLFPVTMLGTSGFKALKSVLPPEAICLPVGGISPSVESMKPYTDIGAQGFGLGAALYKPGMTCDEVRANAKAYVDAFNAL